MSIKKRSTAEHLKGLPASRQIGGKFGPSKEFVLWLDSLSMAAKPPSPLNPKDPLRHGHKVRSNF